MPELEERFESFHMLRKHDVGIKTNVMKLIAYQEKLGIKKNEPVCMIVDYNYVFNGFNAIKNGLFARIDECVAERLEPDWGAPQPIALPPDVVRGLEIARERAKLFTMAAVLIGGLADGLNPCAIGTLVFFMSLLAVSKIRGRNLIMMGTAFCLASFITYTAIGFGLLRALHVARGFPVARMIIEWVMIGLLGIFAVLSFLDAYRYKDTGVAKDVSLQLPHRIKLGIHKIMRAGLGAGSLILGGILIGTTVTALESVCTGQVYVPTLVLVIREGKTVTKAWPLLLLYNTMFILPLVLAFILTYFGLRTGTLMAWSRKNVVPSKTLLGCFFLAMAILMLVLK